MKRHAVLMISLLMLAACAEAPPADHAPPVPSAARGGYETFAAVDTRQTDAALGVAGTIVEKDAPSPPSSSQNQRQQARRAQHDRPTRANVAAPQEAGLLPPAAEQASSPARAPLPAAPSSPVATPPAASSARPLPGAVKGEYVLGIGDELKMTVYGEDDLSGSYLIGSTGTVDIPLIGNVPAAGLTINQFEAAVTQKLGQGYIKDPKIAVEVATYRPFFILGEVAKPGSYPYINGLSVLGAVALAGGYTYRADKDDIRVTHAGQSSESEADISQDGAVTPGDILRVTERFF